MKNLNLLILVLAINLMPVKAQEIGKVWSCHTADDINPKSITQSDIITRNAYDTNPKIINIYVHIIRQSSGSGELSTSEVNSTLNLLYLDYSSANITFNEIGRSYINNNTFYSGIDDSNYSSLISTNNHSNAIDIYFLSPSDSYSRASGIPGTALAIGGEYAGTSVLSHETGHTLGLYHTHSGSGCYDYANCSENIDGSNCITCGDLVCDTPADPCLAGKVTTDCIFIGDSRYTPDVNNIMSYAPPSCLAHFSNGQIERLHDMITNASILQSAWTSINISGSTSLCYSGSQYSVTGLPSNATITWSTSNDISRISAQGSNPCIFQGISGVLSFNSYIKATISYNGNTFTIEKDIQVGTKTPSIQVKDASSHLVMSSGVVGNSYYCAAIGNNLSNNSSDYIWTITFPADPITGRVTSILGENFSPPYSGNYIIELQYRGECGWGSPVTKNFVVVGGNYFRIYPNPTSSDNVTIEQTVDSKTMLTSASNIEITVFDNLMHQILQKKVEGKEYHMNTASLKKGIYYVQVKMNDINEIHKLTIK